MGHEAGHLGTRAVPGQQDGPAHLRPGDDPVRQRPPPERPAADALPTDVGQTAVLHHGTGDGGTGGRQTLVVVSGRRDTDEEWRGVAEVEITRYELLWGDLIDDDTVRVLSLIVVAVTDSGLAGVNLRHCVCLQRETDAALS